MPFNLIPIRTASEEKIGCFNQKTSPTTNRQGTEK